MSGPAVGDYKMQNAECRMQNYRDLRSAIIKVIEKISLLFCFFYKSGEILLFCKILLFAKLLIMIGREASPTLLTTHS